jgi:hypothetical protein
VHFLMYRFSIVSHKATATPPYPNATVAMKIKKRREYDERVSEVERRSFSPLVF